MIESPWRYLFNADEFVHFRYLMRDVCLLEVGLLKEGSANLDLRKGKLLFSLISFLFHFYEFIVVKTKFISVLESQITLRAWRIEKRTEKGRKFKNSPKTLRIASEFRAGWSLPRYVRSLSVGLVHPHTKLVSILWFLNWLNEIVNFLKKHGLILVKWVFECLLLLWFVILGCFSS